MKGEKLIGTVTRGVHATIKPFTWIAAVVLCMMVLLLTAHIVGRSLFSKPLLGTAEIVGLMLCTVVWLVVVYAQVAGGHIRIVLVVERLPRRVQAILGSIVYFINGVFFVIMGWQSAVLVEAYLFPRIRLTNVHLIPLFPFIIVIVIGSLLLGVEMLMKCFHPLPSEEERKES